MRIFRCVINVSFQRCLSVHVMMGAAAGMTVDEDNLTWPVSADHHTTTKNV